jgi:hypothetical protein
VTEADLDALALALFGRWKSLCGACAAALGLATTGPSVLPRPSTCWACSITKKIHGAHRA